MLDGVAGWRSWEAHQPANEPGVPFAGALSRRVRDGFAFETPADDSMAPRRWCGRDRGCGESALRNKGLLEDAHERKAGPRCSPSVGKTSE